MLFSKSHPENEPPYDVLLSQLGTFRYAAKYSAQIPANTSLNDFYEKAFLNLLLRDPENFTAVGLPESYYPTFRPDKLTNVTDAYLRDTNALIKQYLSQLRSYDPKAQTPQQLVSTAIMDWHLDNLVRGQDFTYDDYIVNPVTGVQNSVLDLLNNLATPRQQTGRWRLHLAPQRLRHQVRWRAGAITHSHR